MRSLVIILSLLVAPFTHAAGTIQTNGIFGGLLLGGTTNIISDNGTTLTRNGSAISGGGGIVGTVSNSVAQSGLLAVDATKTNGVAATFGMVTNALNYLPATNGATIATAANWVASGTTNSTLTGQASAFGFIAASSNSLSGFGTNAPTHIVDIRGGTNSPLRIAGIYSTNTEGGAYFTAFRNSDFSIGAGMSEITTPQTPTNGDDYFVGWAPDAAQYAVRANGVFTLRDGHGLTYGAQFIPTERFVVSSNGIAVWGRSVLDNAMPSYPVDVRMGYPFPQLHLNMTNTVDDGLYLMADGAGSGSLAIGAMYNLANFYAKAVNAGWITYGGVGDWYIRADTGLTVGNAYTPTTIMFIQHGGHVGINNTSPNASYALDVTGATRSTTTVTAGSGFISGTTTGITTTWTNMISGVITQRITAVGGIIVTNLTL